MRPLSIVVPARNEEQRLPALLTFFDGRADEILAAAGFVLTELIVIDDGSTDATADLVRSRAAHDERIRLVRGAGPRGKGAAVRQGMLTAQAPWALLMDADLSAPLEDVAKLGAALDAGADIAIGSRGARGSEIEVHQPVYRELAGKTFNLLVRGLTGLPFHDTQCGFKLFRVAVTRALFEEQRIDGFAFDVEILLHARRRAVSVSEVPVRWSNDPQTRVDLLRASARMSFDLVRVAATRRRKSTREAGAVAAASAPVLHSSGMRGRAT
jgi:dolichyl-phosphate beta-glucosyltransferase